MSAPTETDAESAPMGSAHSWIELVRARWYWLLLGAALGATSGTVWAVNQPKIYEARATLEYDFGPSDAGTAAAGEAAFSVHHELIRTQNYLLKSRTLAERVVRKLALDDKVSATRRNDAGRAAAFERAVAQVQTAVDVVAVPGTRIATIRARAATPSAAAELANALVDEYLEKSTEDRIGESSRALEWLRAEQSALKDEVEESELAVFKFREQHQALTASLDERRDLISQRRQSYNAALTELRIKRVQAQARFTVLKEAIASQSDPLMAQAGPIAADPTILALREQYRNAHAQLRELSSSEPESPRTLAAERLVETIRNEVSQQLDAILRGAQAELKEVERAEAGLQQALTEVQKLSMDLSREELEFTSLEREHANRRERYTAVLERTAKADLARALGASEARVVDRALPSAAPIQPQVEIVAALGAALGLLASALLTSFARSRVPQAASA